LCVEISQAGALRLARFEQEKFAQADRNRAEGEAGGRVVTGLNQRGGEAAERF
jgi:hypothetical protein